MDQVQSDVDLLEGLNSFEHQIDQFTQYVQSFGDVELAARWASLGTAWLDWMAQTRAQRLGVAFEPCPRCEGEVRHDPMDHEEGDYDAFLRSLPR